MFIYKWYICISPPHKTRKQCRRKDTDNVRAREGVVCGNTVFAGYNNAVAYVKSQYLGLLVSILDKIKPADLSVWWGGAHDVLSPYEKLLAVGGYCERVNIVRNVGSEGASMLPHQCIQRQKSVYLKKLRQRMKVERKVAEVEKLEMRESWSGFDQNTLYINMDVKKYDFRFN